MRSNKRTIPTPRRRRNKSKPKPKFRQPPFNYVELTTHILGIEVRA